MEETLVIKLGYRGGKFSGFAEQPGLRTVAGELRRALETALRRPCELTCAGRTDAGVHALAQHVSLPVTQEELNAVAPRLSRMLTALTPEDISIRGLYRAEAGFSARFDAVARGYRYRIACGDVTPVLAWGHAWWLRSAANLDVEAMDAAAQCLVGEHDFKSFCKVSSAENILADGRSTSRYLSNAHVSRILEAGEELVSIEVAGNAFLHNMVRAITGTLVEVGQGRRDAAWVAQVLEARDRRAAGPTAPALGLTFERVDYPEGALVKL
ncbi:MAG: tRNA pseudouridine(38-40) synthase TruA [Coriobacteriales bacterium]|nr:tRNA pseudouridine(38-40) synthase TruA [Coriobacteriales bacterium]